MKNIVISNTSVLTVVVGLTIFLLIFYTMPLRPQMWVYPIVRQVMQMKTNYETAHMQVYETQHFKIKYTKADADTIEMIGKAAEAAYVPVTRELGYAPQSKTLILVQPDRNELRKSFGWSGNESAMGVYWAGVIQLLSPHAWLKSDESIDEFIRSGPMVHEYTHLVFDHITNGNYPRWFTEGLAQYIEYQINDYEWQTPANKLDGTLYAMKELDENFDDLPNQSLAYRESLAAVRYIADVYGEDKLQGIIKELKTGRSLETAIQKHTGLNYAAFEHSWQQWAVKNMKNYEGKK